MAELITVLWIALAYLVASIVSNFVPIKTLI
jgi:hypothetical protein